MTSAYSFSLKRIPDVDVLLLAVLYAVRVIAGAAAVAILPSFSLLAFCMFIFLSLALSQRYTESLGLQQRGELTGVGRGWHVGDLPLVQTLGTSAGLNGVLVLALYIDSEPARQLYASPLAGLSPAGVLDQPALVQDPPRRDARRPRRLRAARPHEPADWRPGHEHRPSGDPGGTGLSQAIESCSRYPRATPARVTRLTDRNARCLRATGRCWCSETGTATAMSVPRTAAMSCSATVWIDSS